MDTEFKFRTHPLERSWIDVVLQEKGIPVGFRREISSYQAAIAKEDSQSEIGKFKSEHPVRGFIYRHTQGVVIWIIIIAFLLKNINDYVFGFTMALALLILIWSTKIYVAHFKEEEYWNISPFSEFAGEYTGTIAERIRNCEDLKVLYPNSCDLELSVEHHPKSPHRFLLVSNPNDDSEDSYIVECWKKPE